eukprot:3007004-Amphidinium_carterae.2
MWITCGKVPASYMDNPTDPRRGYYNFHTEVHYTITDYMNLYDRGLQAIGSTVHTALLLLCRGTYN